MHASQITLGGAVGPHPIPAKIARHGALGLGGSSAPGVSALVTELSTNEAVVLSAEPLAPRTLVTIELSRPLRPHSEFCRRVTLVGRVAQCERLNRRDAALVGDLPDHRRTAARILVQALSTDECLASWRAALQGNHGGAGRPARAV